MILTLLSRNIAAFYLFIVLNYVPDTLLVIDVKYCYIKDTMKHEVNRKLLRAILDKELANLDSNTIFVDKASYISSRITNIANSFLKNWFLPSAYDIPNFDQNSIISYNCFLLWEGEKNHKKSIPLTFFVYIWPSEELALKHNSTHPLN